MSSIERTSALTGLARIGFSELAAAESGLGELQEALGLPREAFTSEAASAADPDAALTALVRIVRRDPAPVRALQRDPQGWHALWALLGASTGFADFYLRHPDELAHLEGAGRALPTSEELRVGLLDSVGAVDGFAQEGGEAAWVALRTRYRRLLARVAAFDLLSADPVEEVPAVAAILADAAGAALEASLSVARTRVSGGAGGALFPREQVARTQLAVIGMGKTGARELNYVSDVDVIFVAGGDPELVDEIGESRVVDIATRLAVQLMRGISSVEIEPPLWEVDANLRPEGKQGALVRTLASHLSYYDRWAKSWEFQALLKARPIAGDLELGEAYVAAVQPKIWTSAARENFVDSVQRMRERVTEHIPAGEVAYQIKLGPGGIRDIEFTVQLLQLVHGLTDDRIRQRGTLAALDALVAEGYIGRPEAAAFARHYRALRLLEHRMQLRNLRRTHLMPSRPEELRTLARSTRLADTGAALWEVWESIKREVRDIHVRLFYRPLLSAVAALPADERVLSPEQAHDRLAAIGFADPAGALRHIAALTSGLSRKAAIQRHLMPVMIRWFADGVDPDYGLLAFRRISERLGSTPWFLRMLRDSSAGAESLTRVLSGSRYVGELMEWTPESAAWLDDDELLTPRSGHALQEEARAIQTRHATIADAMRSVRALRRRELLRTAMAALLGTHQHRAGGGVAHHDHRCHDPGDASGRPSRGGAAGRRRPGLRGHRDGPIRGSGTRLRLRRRRPLRLSAQWGRAAARQRTRQQDRGGAAQALRGSPRPARSGRGPASGGTQRPARALPRLVRGVLRPLVAVLGGAGAAAGAGCRGQRQAPSARSPSSPTRCGIRPRPTRRACARSSASRPASRTSAFRRVPTPRAT